VKLKKFGGVALFICLFLLIPPVAFAQQQWSQGYWTPWGNPGIPASDIEWGGLTHVVHAWALVRADGSLDLDTQLVSSQGPVLISGAHAHGVKALLGIGQSYWTGQTTNLQSAITKNRAGLVSNIMNVVNSYGFDGVDLDWEPFSASTNGGAMQAFAADLRAQLGTTKTLSAAAIVNDYAYWGTVQSYFDRIGAMTYDLTGTWNPYSWHNAALYDTDGMVWSVDLAVKRFTASGVPAAKLSIGIPFFGYSWNGGGVSAPRQTWQTAPSLQQIYYQSLAASINAQNYRWDASATVPYLSIDAAGTSSDQFWTYDNEQSVAEKVRYAQGRGLGGWIIWELFGDYFPAQTPNQPLLVAIKNARTGGGSPPDTTPPTVTINQAGGQADPTSSSPINFTVVFSETVTGFSSSDVTLAGTAPGSVTATVTGSGATYNVAVSGMSGSGTVVAVIPAGAVTDGGGNPNSASASTDNIVTYSAPATPPPGSNDATRPSVTVNQASGQADPTGASPVHFTVVFSEPVTGFDASDVMLGGGTGLVASVSGSGTTYDIAVSGMTASGTITASIPAGAVTDLAGNPNTASTSNDNVVRFRTKGRFAR
jgi:GH18 family chitinase